jgi:hypothetical protein
MICVSAGRRGSRKTSPQVDIRPYVLRTCYSVVCAAGVLGCC